MSDSFGEQHFHTRNNLVSIIDDVLRKAAESQSKTNSFISLSRELAQNAAKILANAKESKPLFGLPIAIKDNICVKGTRTTCASKLLENFVPTYDATAVARLLRDGAIVVGKTNMDEFAMGSSSETSHFGPVKNPRDLSKVAGGSSGGSAAAVADGVVSLALGSDTGGSIRQPASYCGVVGFKPSYGAISRFGLIAHGSSLDQIGPIASSTKLCALAFQSMSGVDERDQTTRAVLPRTANNTLTGLRIGFVSKSWTDACDSRIQKMMVALRSQFRKLGATIIDEVDPGFQFALPCYYILSSAEASSNLSRFDGIRYGNEQVTDIRKKEVYAPFRSSRFGAEVKRRIMLGTYVLSEGYADQYYRKAVSARQRIIAQTNKMFAGADLFITPVAAGSAFGLGEKSSDPVAMYQSDTFTTYANLAKIPAIALPFRDDQFTTAPIGFQMHAAYRHDWHLLDAAQSYEAAHDD